MRTLRAAIVDDEPLARARLRRLLGEEQAVEVVAEFGDGEAAARELPSLAADVVFLDVRMPQLDGFAMLDRLPPALRPLVVFVTAYSEHAVQAFDARALDYLVKPVAPDRLRDSVARARRQLGQGEAVAAGAAPAAAYPERLVVPDGARLRIVPVQEIECVLAQGNYVELRMGGRGVLLRETMANIQTRLDPRLFVRIHRSRIVRIDLIEQIEPCGAGQYVLRMRGGMRITSGRRYRAQLRGALGLPLAGEGQGRD
ncbi:LytR/AlgR family response regulator transcription factor [Luteimonas aquatica]|uniref:LytR/AlgR family response regulator transcription factor n=1 Tax=Luteimonas aquatica TaxID=450364 RepID=UPI001F55E198|nr:LytTR family DNA-binding domain-containing protein [Luteimonas aquatica]